MTKTATKLTQQSVEENKTIIILTADKVGMTGIFSWSYMFTENDNSDDRYVLPADIVCGLPFGFLWTSDDSESDGRPYNIFQSGKGLLVGGGFEKFVDKSDSPFRRNDYDVDYERTKQAEWQIKMLDGIPACSILMTTENFEWLKQHILDDQDRDYVRYHSEHPISTS